MKRKRVFHDNCYFPIWGQGLREITKTRWKSRTVCALPQYEQGTSRTQVRSVSDFPEACRIYIEQTYQIYHIYIWRRVTCPDVDTADWSLITALCHVHGSGHDWCYEDHDFWRMWRSSPSTSWFRSFDEPFRLLKLIFNFPQSSEVFREFLFVRTSLFLFCKLLTFGWCGRKKMWENLIFAWMCISDTIV